MAAENTASSTAALTGPADRPERRRTTLVVGGVGLALVLAVLTPPLWASLRYRSAVNNLHAELATVGVETADVVDARVEQCWNGEAPASVRTLVPTGDQTLSEVVSDYVDALEPLGFESQGGVTGLVASRAVDNDLDGDLITVTIDDANGRITVTADAHDIDLVSCLPW